MLSFSDGVPILHAVLSVFIQPAPWALQAHRDLGGWRLFSAEVEVWQCGIRLLGARHKSGDPRLGDPMHRDLPSTLVPGYGASF